MAGVGLKGRLLPWQLVIVNDTGHGASNARITQELVRAIGLCAKHSHLRSVTSVLAISEDQLRQPHHRSLSSRLRMKEFKVDPTTDQRVHRELQIDP